MRFYHRLHTLPLIFISTLVIAFSASAQQKEFGIGTIVGGPSGLSYKAWISPNVAIAGAFDLSIGNNFGESYYTHIDL